jgi:hypothetical protein
MQPDTATLAGYQAAADAIYQPEKQAESDTLAATDATTKATLEAEAPQIQTDYQSAIDKLTQSVTNQTGQIDQLYASRLGGNFSGLQGNAMGNLYATADEQQSIISQTEANKLTALTTAEGNADVTYEADLAALTPKYQSEENSYVASEESAADTQANEDRTYDLDVEKVNIDASNTATSDENAYLDKFTATAKSGANTSSGGAGPKNPANGFAYTGPNGATINLGQYASVLGQGNDDSALSIITNQLSQSGTSTDKSALSYIGTLQKSGASSSDILTALANNKTYSADFAGL